MVEKEFVLNHGGFHLHLDDIRALISVLMVALVVAARSASRIKGKPDSNLARLPVTIYRRTDGGSRVCTAQLGVNFPTPHSGQNVSDKPVQKIPNDSVVKSSKKSGVFTKVVKIRFLRGLQ